jgi:D-3-phosphoglycerate dehydrogenase
MPRILITPRSLTTGGHPALDRLAEAGFEVVTCTPGKLPSPQELIGLLPGCVGWLAGVEPVPDAVIDAASELRVISRNGAGVDNLPLALLAQRGVRVLKAEGANASGVAELAIALTLAGLRHIPFSDAGVKAGGWPRRQGCEIRGRTVGVIGCGAVGSEVARLAVALGAEALGYDVVRRPLALERFRWATLNEIVEQADVISLHCPALADGSPLLDAAMLARARSGLVLVNTARASLIDEAAVLAGLEAGHLATYATDVFDAEPPRNLDFVRHPRVIATSHIGGFTAESVERAARTAVNNLLAALIPGHPDRDSLVA